MYKEVSNRVNGKMFLIFRASTDAEKGFTKENTHP